MGRGDLFIRRRKGEAETHKSDFGAAPREVYRGNLRRKCIDLARGKGWLNHENLVFLLSKLGEPEEVLSVYLALETKV